MARTKIVFLYTELAGYFLACLKELSLTADIRVVRWPVNKEAPFDFKPGSGIEILDRGQFSDAELVRNLHDYKPDILVCSGWIDKGYLRAVKSFRKKIPCVLTLDNHWTGSLKQRIAALVSPVYIKRIFTHAWVPGNPQYQFARQLGFGDRILRNFYCADTDLFNRKFEATFEAKAGHFPKRFLYVGRYVKHKGIYELWQAFAELQREQPNEWELWCLGTGEEWENRVEHPKIRHLGFVQPEEMQYYIESTGVYILPSTFEPWGVTVQEFAVCGFPLLLSDAIGSGEKFLRENENGFVFPSGSVAGIKKVLQRVVEMPDNALVGMGRESHALGMSLIPADWANGLMKILEN